MSRLVKLSVLSAQLGISRRTLSDWCLRDPSIAVRRGGKGFWIKLDKLAGKPGIDLVEAHLIGEQRWIKAVELAEMAGIPRRTIGTWCRRNANFARRLGRIWYVNLSRLDITTEELESRFGSLKFPQRRGRPCLPPLQLTSAERSVILFEGGRRNRAILMLADGVSTKNVASRLRVSEATICRYRKQWLLDNPGNSGSSGE